MFKKTNTKTTKLLAGILAVLLVIGAFPAGTQLVALAATVDSYTITLTDGTDVISINDVEITVTDKSDSDKTKTVKTVDGIATFENFVVEDSIYTVSVESVQGYEDVADFEIAPVAEGEMNANATMTAIEKIKITGVVTDENDAPYRGATVELSGYVTGTTKTNADGEYSFDAYKGKDYTVKATAKEGKYEVASATITAPAADHNSTLKFAVKYYSVTTSANEGGTITESDNSVEYGSNKTIEIIASEGYRIESITGYEGNEEVNGKQNFTFDLENIQENKTVSVVFKKQIYKVSFDVSANGKVEYNTSSYAEGGKVTDVDVDELGNINFEAIAHTGYHVEKVTVDSAVLLEGGNNANDKYRGEVEKVTKDVTVTVVFTVNTYTVNVNSDHGTYEITGSTNGTDGIVDYGNDIILKIKNEAGWSISSVKDSDNNDLTYEHNDDTGTYDVAISDVDSDIDVTVNYSPNDKVYSFKDNVSVEITDGTDSVKFNTSDSNVLESFDELTPENTNNLLVSKEGRTFVFKKGVSIKLTNKNKNFWGDPRKLEVQFAAGSYSMNQKGWYAPGSGVATLSRSCVVTNVQVKPDDMNTINVQIDDNNKEISPSEYTKKYEFVLDNTAPVVTPDAINPEWTNADTVTINGSVTDNLNKGQVDANNPSSSLSHIIWSKDNALSADEVLAATESKVTIDKDGKFTFESVEGEQASTYYIYAVDIAGNVSKAAEVAVKIDKVLPSVDNVTKAPATEWTNSAVNVTVVATDANETDTKLVSGIARVVYTTDKNADATTLKNTATFNKKEGAYEFTVSDVQQEIYYIYAIDNAGNVSAAETIEIKINKDKPTVESADRNPPSEWHNNDVTITGTVSVKEKASPVNRVVYTTNENANAAALGAENTANLDKTAGTYEFTLAGEQNSTYYIYAIDEAGNVSDAKTVDVKIDMTKPFVESENGFEFKKKNDSSVEKLINFLSFGLFFEEEIEVTVSVGDGTEVDDSQCKEVVFRLYENNASSGIYTETAPVVVEENKATTTIPVDFKGVIKAIVYDNAGNNSGEVIATNANSNMEDNETGFIMIENTASSIVFNQTNPVANDKNWYNKKDITVPVSISDETNNEINSGLYSIKAELFYNREEIASQTVEFNAGLGIDTTANAAVLSKNIDLTIGTDADDIFEYVGDGEYKILVSVVDNCGNATSNESVLYVDTTSAVVTEFILGEKVSEGVVEETDYGYYFKEDVDVIVTLDDTIEGVKDISDIAKVLYYTVDYSDVENPVKSENLEAEYDAVNHKAIIPVTGEFKGQIYVWSIDNADNDSTKAYDGSDVEPVKPDGSILEPVGRHEQEEHIVFTKDATEFAANDGTELYANDVPVTLTVIDTYSGIREIEWEVVAPYDTENNQSGKVTVNNDRTVTEESDSDWEQTKTEVNLVTEMQKTITVSNNSNNIVVKVKMTDRAGNSTEKEIEFSIDKTKPEIKVEYADDKHNEKYGEFFNYDRVATITVTERNFSSKDVDVTITNTHEGEIPVVSKWKEHKNTEEPDKTYYTAKIVYAEDGDYTFDIGFSDLAKNDAGDFKVQKFTIDQTIPKVSVKYDNNDALNKNYYKAERTATITIKEHNFNAKDVKVVGVATDNGEKVAFPKTSKWVSDGDTRVATIKYSADAKYVFDIEFEDKAGNSIKNYKPVEFYVDQTAPTLEITGVANQSANNGIVAPVVTVTDTNYNKDAVTISLSGINNGKVNYSGAFKDITNGQTFTYANFEKAQNVDDIYTLNVTLTDMAGNATTKAISFSVNRFGSVYDLTEIKDINGKYSKVEKDIVIVETNTDTLDRDSIKVKLTKGRTTTDLKEGKDYTVVQTGGNGTWSQYKYTIKKSLFAGDGRYSISIYSVDGAGNENQNIVESKDAIVSFAIDKTSPLITPIDFESGTKNQPTEYDVETKTVSIEIKDNLSLKDVVIYLNDNKVKYEVDGDTYIIEVPESDEQQEVKVVAKDSAGNEHTVLVEHVLVSTNWLVRWYNNKPVFFGSIAGVLGVAGLIIFFVVKKKKKDEEENQ